MSYDLEKYRDKREKVLGVRRRGVSFGTIALTVSTIIIFGLGVIVIPRAVAFWQNRNLDDVIYKTDRPPAAEQLERITTLPGVDAVAVEKERGRMVVTFDRTAISVGRLTAIFARNGVNAVQLNHMNHAQRLSLQQKESVFAAIPDLPQTGDGRSETAFAQSEGQQ